MSGNKCNIFRIGKRGRTEKQVSSVQTLDLFPHGRASSSYSSNNGMDEDAELRAYYDSQPPIATGVLFKQHSVNRKLINHYDFFGLGEQVEETVATMATERTENQEVRWKINKVLTASDVNGSSRLLLPNDKVAKHVLKYIDENEITVIGKQVRVWDEDKEVEHTMRLAKWVSSGAYVLKDGWKGKIVDGRKLKMGDTVGFYWDPVDSRFIFSVLAVSNPTEALQAAA
ncbi:hypothetical protein QQ045_018174 [Rhodiola kirilowii]